MNNETFVYKNGNTFVSIGQDGTKIRYTRDGEKPCPEYPESIDLKITNRCPIGCPMCHEQSTPDGEHADLSNPLLNSLQPYTELALGGGDPLSNPELQAFLERMKAKNVICNLTVHWRSFEENYEKLKTWRDHGLIYGLGVSINETVPCEVAYRLTEFPNAVVHMIVGLTDESVIRQLMDRNLNILLLGYKTFGRGSEYAEDAERRARIRKLTDTLAGQVETLTRHFRAVSFDNLAIRQLAIGDKMSHYAFKRFYMGNDGEFTMYVDLVKNEFAVSSVSERKKINSSDIRELFREVRSDAGRIV